MSKLEILESEIKELIVQSLKLEDVKPKDIQSDQPLFVEGLGLDSIDALELSVALSKKYGIKLEEKNPNFRSHFASVRSLAAFVSSHEKGIQT